MKEDESVEFKKSLAELKAGLITEGRYTGIPKIMEAMAKNGSPPAEFEFDEDHSYFMVRLPAHPAALEVAQSAAGEATSPVRPESGLESGLESATSSKVLEALSKGPLNRSTLAEALGHERVSGAINRAIKELLAKGLIEYTVPERPNSRLQKYRIVQGDKRS